MLKGWDPETGEQAFTVGAHKRQIFCMAFNPEGTLLATGGQDHRLRLAEAGTGAETRTIPPLPDAVRSLAFTRDGTGLVAGGWDGVARLYSTADSKLLREFPSPAPAPKK